MECSLNHAWGEKAKGKVAKLFLNVSKSAIPVPGPQELMQAGQVLMPVGAGPLPRAMEAQQEALWTGARLLTL